MWDLVTQRPVGDPIVHGSRSVTALAFGDVAEYSIAVTGGDDSTVRLWDLSSGAQLGEPLIGHTNDITSLRSEY
jgi:WD40 repeat protein